MKLYKIWQEINDDYDTYDSAVVAAETENEAKLIHPSDNTYSKVATEEPGWVGGDWAWFGAIKCVLIGEAAEGTETGVIVASFNAG